MPDEDFRANNGISNAIYEHLRAMSPHHASFSERERLSIILLSDVRQEIARLRLTAEEREAIEWYAGYGRDGLHAATLRSLLERLT